MNPIWILTYESPEMKGKLQRKHESHIFAVIIYNGSSVIAELGKGFADKHEYQISGLLHRLAV